MQNYLNNFVTRGYFSHVWPENAFKGNIVNRTWHFINKEFLEITSTDPLNIELDSGLLTRYSRRAVDHDSFYFVFFFLKKL